VAGAAFESSIGQGRVVAATILAVFCMVEEPVIVRSKVTKQSSTNAVSGLLCYAQRF